MYDYTIHPRSKNFDCYSLQAFRTADTLKCHINEGFKINAKKRLICQKKWTSYIQKFIEENKVTIFDLCIFWKNFSCKKKMGSEIQTNLTQANIKNMLLAVMAIN